MKRRVKFVDYKYLLRKNTRRFLLKAGLREGVITAEELFNLAKKGHLSVKIEPYVWDNIVARFRGEEINDLSVNQKKLKKKKKKLLRIKQEEEAKKKLEEDTKKKLIKMKDHLKHLKRDPSIKKELEARKGKKVA